MDSRELLDLYSRHFNAPGRRPDTAVSLPSLQWLNLHGLPDVRERLGVIHNLADLGTGVSSAFFRLWLHRDQIAPGVVWSVDTDLVWLGRTCAETTAILETHHGIADAEELLGWWHTWDGFEDLIGTRIAPESFQVVFLDTAPAYRRPRLLGVCNEILVPGGLLVVDDWHKEHNREMGRF